MLADELEEDMGIVIKEMDVLIADNMKRSDEEVLLGQEISDIDVGGEMVIDNVVIGIEVGLG